MSLVRDITSHIVAVSSRTYVAALRKLKIVHWSIEAQEFLALAGILLVLCLGSYAMRWTNPTGYLFNLGPNLLAGFVGSAVTIFGFDVILRRRQRRLNLPIRMAVYFDICILCEKAITPAGVEVDATDLDSLRQTMAMRIEETAWSDDARAWLQDVTAYAARILERYVGLLEPRIVEGLQFMAASTAETLTKRSPDSRIAFDSDRDRWFRTTLFVHMWSWEEFEALGGEKAMWRWSRPLRPPRVDRWRR